LLIETRGSVLDTTAGKLSREKKVEKGGKSRNEKKKKKKKEG
jgi:hypothetical protein